MSRSHTGPRVRATTRRRACPDPVRVPLGIGRPSRIFGPDRARLQYTVELPWREAVRSNFNGFVVEPPCTIRTILCQTVYYTRVLRKNISLKLNFLDANETPTADKRSAPTSLLSEGSRVTLAMPDGDWTPGFVKRFEERLEPKPIQKCLFLLVIFVIPVAIIALVPTLIDALISSKNLFLFVGYSALRRVTQWLSDLFTFFYYVNQARIADLEGAKKFTTAGGFVVLASFASIGMGLLMMALCMICASPLLRFLAPYEPELVDQTAYWALIIAAAWLPGQIFLSSGSGVLLAQRQIVRLYLLVLFWVLLATVLLLLITLNNTCDQQLEEANRTIPDLDTERWVCPDDV